MTQLLETTTSKENRSEESNLVKSTNYISQMIVVIEHGRIKDAPVQTNIIKWIMYKLPSVHVIGALNIIIELFDLKYS